MDIITCDSSMGMEMIDILELSHFCEYCECDITEDTYGGIYGTTVVCNDVLCLIQFDGYGE